MRRKCLISASKQSITLYIASTPSVCFFLACLMLLYASSFCGLWLKPLGVGRSNKILCHTHCGKGAWGTLKIPLSPGGARPPNVFLVQFELKMKYRALMVYTCHVLFSLPVFHFFPSIHIPPCPLQPHFLCKTPLIAARESEGMSLSPAAKCSNSQGREGAPKLSPGWSGCILS